MNMDFNNFIATVKEEVQKLVGDRYNVTVNCVMKINRELQGLSIRNQNTEYCPSIYLEDYYQEYQSGKSVIDIAEEIVSISRQKNLNISGIVENLQDYEWVKPRLRVKLINYQRNVKLLKTIPHERILDLAIIPYIHLKKDNEIMSIKVHYPLMDVWNITSDSLMHIAKNNTLIMNPVVVEEMTHFILRMIMDDTKNLEVKTDDNEEILKSIFHNDQMQNEMYILTNKSNLDGAYAAFQTKELKDLSYRIGSDELYLLPSSIHEVIVVNAKGMDPYKLREMVISINSTQVEDKDFLSDSIYHYDRVRDLISVVE